MDDNLIPWSAVKDDTFHFTVVDGAALTTLTPATPAKTPTRSSPWRPARIRHGFRPNEQVPGDLVKPTAPLVMRQ